MTEQCYKTWKNMICSIQIKEKDDLDPNCCFWCSAVLLVMQFVETTWLLAASVLTINT